MTVQMVGMACLIYLQELYLDYAVMHNFSDPVTLMLTRGRDSTLWRPKLDPDAQYANLGDASSAFAT